MKCPRCGKPVYVFDSRDNGERVRRRRQCPKCGFRFTTYEVYADEYEHYKAVKKTLAKIKSLLGG